MLNSTEEEGTQSKAKARIQLVPNPAFAAGAQDRRPGQAQSQAAAPQGPAGEPSSDSSDSEEDDDKPDKPGEDQDMEAHTNKGPLLSPTEPATSPGAGSQGSNSPGEDQEEAAAPPKANPSEGTSPPEGHR